jgi:hypothetical protein
VRTRVDARRCERRPALGARATDDGRGRRACSAQFSVQMRATSDGVQCDESNENGESRKTVVVRSTERAARAAEMCAARRGVRPRLGRAVAQERRGASRVKCPPGKRESLVLAIASGSCRCAPLDLRKN